MGLSTMRSINVHLTTIRDNRMRTKGACLEGMVTLSQLNLRSGNLGPLCLGTVLAQYIVHKSGAHNITHMLSIMFTSHEI